MGLTHTVRSIQRLLPGSRWRPTWRTHVLLARRCADAIAPDPQADVVVDSPDNGRFGTLVAFASEQGLDQEWCQDQLRDGAIAFLALSGSGDAVGMGLLTRRPFYVAEIEQTFDPGPQGCYLYATYVTPSARGQKIQRRLDHHRLAHAATLGANIGYALVESDNTASLRGHAAGGFAVVARHTRFAFRSRVLTVLRQNGLPSTGARFTGNGALVHTRLHP